MPLVFVTANRGRTELNENTLVELGTLLREWVAAELTCSDRDGDLTYEDIEVEIKQRRPRLDIGGERYDIQVTVFANDFPSRKANLSDRCACINERLQQWTAGRWRGYVWVLLAPAAFAEF